MTCPPANELTLPEGELSQRCELVVGDITDRQLVEQCFKNVEYCFHLAAVASVQRSNEDWAGTHRINLTGSINVFDAARSKRIPVVYASSAAVYGDNAATPLQESAQLRPLTAYGADKLGSELHARVASLVHSVPTTGLRFFNVYGPRQCSSSPYSGVISIFANRVSKREPLIIFGDGEQTRDFIFVKDVVRFLFAAMQTASQTPACYNVCTGRSTTVNQLAKMLMSISGNRVPIHYQPSRNGDIRISIGSPQLSERTLNYHARVPLASGLRTLMLHEQANKLNYAIEIPKLGLTSTELATPG